MERRPDDVPTDDPSAVARVASMLDRPVMIACDVDGTLSAITATPDLARLEPGAIGALRSLRSCGVHVVVVSGRSLRELREQFGLGGDDDSGDPRHGLGDLLLVGSHGAEMSGAPPLDPREVALLQVVRDELEQLARTVPGALVEVKPCAVALHVRRVAPDAGDVTLEAVRARYARSPGLTLLDGKRVVEVSVRSITKGRAVERLRDQLEPASVMFVGDDVSDESVFAILGPHDLAVRVGQGRTLADHRLAEPADVVQMLTELAALWA